MIIIDTLLARREAEGAPVRVAVVGGGYMARCITLQLLTAGRGMRLALLANRTTSKAERALREAGAPEWDSVSALPALEEAMRHRRIAVTDDASLAWESPGIEVIIEATGHVEFGTRVCHEGLRHGKHVVTLSAEVDASVGPLLRQVADAHGVVFTYTDGDEPGVGMNLHRLVDSMGYRPVLMGQMKGFLDRYRNPETQRPLAEKLEQNPAVLASFADGSKLALEAAIMGNATGFVPRQRGMQGYPCAHVNDMLKCFTPADFEGVEGYVEYSLGAAPHTGAFVICMNDHPEKRRLMAYLKMGEGPLYMFHTPYHLPPWQILHSVARAALLKDPTITARGAPVCDTIACAKRDLKRGERLDGMGGYCAYGLVERHGICAREGFLPMAVSLDCTLTRDVPKDSPIRYADVALPAGRLVDALRVEQSKVFREAGMGNVA